VILDAKLSWKQQVEAKCKKAVVLMCQSCTVTGATWEMTQKLCFGYILPPSDHTSALHSSSLVA